MYYEMYYNIYCNEIITTGLKNVSEFVISRVVLIKACQGFILTLKYFAINSCCH